MFFHKFGVGHATFTFCIPLNAKIHFTRHAVCECEQRRLFPLNWIQDVQVLNSMAFVVFILVGTGTDSFTTFALRPVEPPHMFTCFYYVFAFTLYICVQMCTYSSYTYRYTAAFGYTRTCNI